MEYSDLYVLFTLLGKRGVTLSIQRVEHRLLNQRVEHKLSNQRVEHMHSNQCGMND